MLEWSALGDISWELTTPNDEVEHRDSPDEARYSVISANPTIVKSSP